MEIQFWINAWNCGGAKPRVHGCAMQRNLRKQVPPCWLFYRLRGLVSGLTLVVLLLFTLFEFGTALAAPTCTTSGRQVTCTFNFTGAAETWTVPTGVEEATFELYGAQGGHIVWMGYLEVAGGAGGKATANLRVQPGTSYQINVGGQGQFAPNSNSVTAIGGFNGGGNSGSDGWSSAGGGASDIRTGSYSLAERVLVAGGGGGAGGSCGSSYGGSGGAGGGISGAAGGFSDDGEAGGGGGTQNGGGQIGGALGIGGAGGTSAIDGGGGGGGGGYFGGGGGSANCSGGGGGGGSGYGPSNAILESGKRSGNGLVVITYMLDSTPPVITPSVVGTLGNNSWYKGHVNVSWSVMDNESTVISQSGCDAQSVTSDTSGVTFTCSATSAGGSSSQSVTIKRDATIPVVVVTEVREGARYTVGSVPVAGCSTSDALSGVATQASVTVTGGNGDGTGSFTATCSGATDLAGNATSPVSVSYTVAALPTATPTNTPVPPTATPTNTPVPPTATPTVPATTLYATVQQVRHSLAALLPSGDSKTDQSLQKAIAKLDQGLNPAFWQVPAGSHLSAQGEKAFHRLRDAIKELRNLKAPPAAVTSAIDTLTGVGRTLAEQAIAEATAAGGNAKQLAKANKELTKAQQDLAKQRPDLAFAHYEEAWETAQAALGVVLAASELDAVAADPVDADHIHDEGDDDSTTDPADELTHSDQNAQPNLLFLPVVSR